MNLREEILAEHSKKQTAKLVRHIGNDKTRFAELMKLFLGNEYRVTQRAAWVVGNCAEEYPVLIKPYLKKLVENLEKPGLHDAVKRNSLRLLQFIEVPSSLKGKLVDQCFRYILSVDEPIAIKAFSLTVLQFICEKEPDLKQELILVARDLYTHSESAGIRVRCRNILEGRKIKNPA
jgi:hypothetical protein